MTEEQIRETATLEEHEGRNLRTLASKQRPRPSLSRRLFARASSIARNRRRTICRYVKLALNFKLTRRDDFIARSSEACAFCADVRVYFLRRKLPAERRLLRDTGKFIRFDSRQAIVELSLFQRRRVSIIESLGTRAYVIFGRTITSHSISSSSLPFNLLS